MWEPTTGENELSRNSSGNTRPQSSQPACELILATRKKMELVCGGCFPLKKKKKKQVGNESSNLPPKILASEEKPLPPLLHHRVQRRKQKKKKKKAEEKIPSLVGRPCIMFRVMFGNSFTVIRQTPVHEQNSSSLTLSYPHVAAPNSQSVSGLPLVVFRSPRNCFSFCVLSVELYTRRFGFCVFAGLAQTLFRV